MGPVTKSSLHGLIKSSLVVSLEQFEVIICDNYYEVSTLIGGRLSNLIIVIV